jgi:TIR domain
MADRPQQILLSYPREDVAFARELRDRLLAQGQRPWMDLFDIPVGARWPSEIARALKTSDVIIGLMSTAVVTSDNVMNEWDWAIANNRRLILLFFEPCEIPFYIRDQILIVLRRGPQVEWPVYKHLQSATPGQSLDERAKRELLDGTSEDEPATRLEHPSDLCTDDIGTGEMMDGEIDEDRVEGIAGERELFRISFRRDLCLDRSLHSRGVSSMRCA